MVVFLYPIAQPDHEALAMPLYHTRTLHGLMAVREDRAEAVRRVLNTGHTVVVPDNHPASPAFLDVLLALKAVHHPVVRLTHYLQSLTSPTAAPTPVHATPGSGGGATSSPTPAQP